MKKITKKQINNLLKLADFLEFDIQNKQFNIEFMRSHEGDEVSFKSKTECGTAGCALGWSPFIIDFLPSEKSLYSCEWRLYTERVFGVISGLDDWEYLFSEAWHLHGKERTRLATAKRIRDYALAQLAGIDSLEKLPAYKEFKEVYFIYG